MHIKKFEELQYYKGNFWSVPIDIYRGVLSPNCLDDLKLSLSKIQMPEFHDKRIYDEIVRSAWGNFKTVLIIEDIEHQLSDEDWDWILPLRGQKSEFENEYELKYKGIIRLTKIEREAGKYNL